MVGFIMMFWNGYFVELLENIGEEWEFVGMEFEE